MRAFLVGRRPCRGVPVDYFLLVEEWDALWECYGIRVESGGERTEIPGITASQSGIDHWTDRNTFCISLAFCG